MSSIGSNILFSMWLDVKHGADKKLTYNGVNLSVDDVDCDCVYFYTNTKDVDMSSEILEDIDRMHNIFCPDCGFIEKYDDPFLFINIYDVDVVKKATVEVIGFIETDDEFKLITED